MQVTQFALNQGQWDKPLEFCEHTNLVLLFGCADLAVDSQLYAQIRQTFPNAQIIGCSTAGEIFQQEIIDCSLVINAIQFEHAHIKIDCVPFSHNEHNNLIQSLESLNAPDLKYLMVLSDGHSINGSELVEELNKHLQENVVATGGLAGDGSKFEQTYVWHNGIRKTGHVLLCGFYGDNLQVSQGSVGGWDAFGPDRTVTESTNNILYTLDDQPALDLYKKYLGHHAKDLPSSALLFPLLVKQENCTAKVIRTILDIDEDKRAMIFAGDVPVGAKAQLMSANFERLIDGAELAAQQAAASIKNLATVSSGLVFMVSCVGRRMVLKQRAEEELEVVQNTLGDKWTYCGFYSYGEIAGEINQHKCVLHNQTMTVTALYES